MQDNYQEVAIVMVAGMVLFLVLAGIVVFVLLFFQKKKFQHRQQMADLQNAVKQEVLQAQLETQEHTFRQVAGELHDNVGQLLSSAKMLLGITERGMRDAPDTLKVAMETVGQAIGELRSFSKALHPEWLNQFDLLENIRNELDRLIASGRIQGELVTNIAILPLSSQEQVMLFRVMQEAIQNSIRHAEAAVVRVSVRGTEKDITLIVEDDGKGFDPDVKSAKGIGILNMLHRVSLLNGTIRWQPGSISGTAVTIWLPIKAET